MSDLLAKEFDTYRPVLLGAAYRVVGSMTDAEDVVQETWLRWAAADRTEVRDTRAYLVRITTRLALNRLRQQKTQREQYVGPWLPEPIATTSEAEDPAAVAEVADSVSMAMLVVLETLSPLERAAFVLREVFDLPFAEIAETLGRSETAVRQLAHRAREHVHARRPRQTVDKARHAEVTASFLERATQGDFEGVVALLAPDVLLVSDGGGKKSAALRPIQGAEKVTRWLFGVLRREQDKSFAYRFMTVNGEQALVTYMDGELDNVSFVELDESGLITDFYVVRNPDKLTGFPALNQLG
ncbi:RNA polymerase sigma-70 factor [Kribbella deserti]|uniref:RNA polymerase sigma-70 factor n=1 Tax=Kribbella deserti TaxID=1926257 RepID=A0ABV6QWD7_9ACTN